MGVNKNIFLLFLENILNEVKNVEIYSEDKVQSIIFKVCNFLLFFFNCITFSHFYSFELLIFTLFLPKKLETKISRNCD